MEDNNKGLNKSIVYPILAACILGIILIGALVMKSDTSQGFSELYFDNTTELPSIVDAGNEVNFEFKVVSHEKEKLQYEYNTTYDNKLIRSGKFTLQPGQSKSISIDFAPKNSTLMRIFDPKITIYNREGNALIGAVDSKNENLGRTEIITSQNGYSVISWSGNNSRQIDVVQPGKIIIPIQLSMDGFENPISMIILNPQSKEYFYRNFSMLTPIGDLNTVTPNDSGSISNVGYNLKQSQWKIENDQSRIYIRQKNIDTDYRYAFKKVSVEVSSLRPSSQGQNNQYEIHFWVIVTEKLEPDNMSPS